jgi:hypothetical protein
VASIEVKMIIYKLSEVSSLGKGWIVLLWLVLGCFFTGEKNVAGENDVSFGVGVTDLKDFKVFEALVYYRRVLRFSLISSNGFERKRVNRAMSKILK